jgi:transcriptional regulator with XRE-family HTH domain
MRPPDAELAALGQVARERRLELDLSVQAAARQWGVEPAWLLALERGRVNPRLDALGALARGMEISLAELFRRVERVRDR